LFWVFSLESDLLTPAGFLKTPQGSPASSDPTTSNHGSAGSPRSARSLHVPLPTAALPGSGLVLVFCLGCFVVFFFYPFFFFFHNLPV